MTLQSLTLRNSRSIRPKFYNRSLFKLFLVPALCLFFLVLTGCGYRFGQGTIPSIYRSISVPYVCGDKDGSLTAAIINEFEQSGGLITLTNRGDLLLKTNLIDLRDENIGFRYDRNKRGRLTKSVIPTETRISAVAEISVIERCSGRVILGPVILSASVDFDHDYYSSRNGINIFSLGQLSDIDAARDAVATPLNRALAQKIVEYVNESW